MKPVKSEIGMRVDIGNILRQAGRAAGDRYGHDFMLQQLSKHLQQLRDRTLAGDTKALDEFFKLYVFDDGKDYEDVKTAAAKPTFKRPPLNREFVGRDHRGITRDWDSVCTDNDCWCWGSEHHNPRTP